MSHVTYEYESCHTLYSTDTMRTDGGAAKIRTAPSTPNCAKPSSATSRCNAPQHTATRCNRRQHTVTRCNMLQCITTHCNTTPCIPNCGKPSSVISRVTTHFGVSDMTHILCGMTHSQQPTRQTMEILISTIFRVALQRVAVCRSMLQCAAVYCTWRSLNYVWQDSEIVWCDTVMCGMTLPQRMCVI